MTEFIFMCSDDKVINGEHIVEVDFAFPDVSITFIDGTTRDYNVCNTQNIKSYLKNREIQYARLSDKGTRPQWEIDRED